MRTLILAPHIDDELIGCYSRIKAGLVPDVCYFFDITEERFNEAKNFESSGAIKIVKEEDLNLPSYDIILVPSIQDHHPDHKYVNRKYRRFATSFYSVDMVEATPYSIEDRLYKRNLLNTYYKSQSSLWEHDNKYFIFESIHEHDYQRLYQISKDFYSLAIPLSYKTEVIMCLNKQGFLLEENPEAFFNHLLSIVEGPIVLKVNDTIFRTAPGL